MNPERNQGSLGEKSDSMCGTKKDKVSREDRSMSDLDILEPASKSTEMVGPAKWCGG